MKKNNISVPNRAVFDARLTKTANRAAKQTRDEARKIQKPKNEEWV